MSEYVSGARWPLKIIIYKQFRNSRNYWAGSFEKKMKLLEVTNSFRQMLADTEISQTVEKD